MPASNEIGIVVYPGVLIQSRFASRTGNQRIAAMPNFRAYMTAIRAGAHNLGS
jgi:hypothetical protein